MQISLSAKIAVEISWLIIVFNYTVNVLLFSRFYSRDSQRVIIKLVEDYFWIQLFVGL